MNIKQMLNDEIALLQSTKEYQEYLRVQNALAIGGKINEMLNVKVKQLEKLEQQDKVPTPDYPANDVKPEEAPVEFKPEEPKEKTTEEKVSTVTQTEPEEVGQEMIDIELPDLSDLEDD